MSMAFFIMKENIEIWKDVIGYEGYYEVSNFGRVRSVSRKKKGRSGSDYLMRERILKHRLQRNGYPYIGMSVDGDKKSFNIHRLVAKSFIPNPDNKPQVNHINGDKTDNRVENLEWCDSFHNMQHAYKNGLLNDRRGINAKISKSDVMEIVSLLEKKLTIVDISKMININPGIIQSIKSGNTWSHLTMIEPQKETKKKLLPTEVFDILKLREEGFSLKELSNKYNCNTCTISNILRGICWGDLTGIKFTNQKLNRK